MARTGLVATASGITALPFGTFLLMMLPIHLAIGAIEDVVTAAVVLFVLQAQPELLAWSASNKPLKGLALKPVLIGLGVVAVVAAASLSWFASSYLDGLAGLVGAGVVILIGFVLYRRSATRRDVRARAGTRARRPGAPRGPSAREPACDGVGFHL